MLYKILQYTMAQAQIYIRLITEVMEKVVALYERFYALDGSVNRFGGALRRLDDQVPRNFRIVYRPKADNNGALLGSM